MTSTAMRPANVHDLRRGRQLSGHFEFNSSDQFFHILEGQSLLSSWTRAATLISDRSGFCGPLLSLSGWVLFGCVVSQIWEGCVHGAAL